MGEDYKDMKGRADAASMIVAHLIATNFFGGPEKQIVQHAVRLKERGFRPLLVSFNEGRQNEFLERARTMGIETRELPSRHPLNPLSLSDVLSVIKRDGVDIVCTHGYKTDILGRMAAWIAKVPLVAVSRGWTGESRKIRFYEYLDKAVLKYADHVVSVSAGQKEKVLKLDVRPERASVIYNGVDASDAQTSSRFDVRKGLGIGGEKIIVASAGRLSPEKNFSGLVRAAAVALGKEKGLAFVVFGEGPLRRRLEEEIRKEGLQESFFLPGFREDFTSILAQADIFAQSSFTEGLPNVVLEAYAQKKPVVATAVGGTPEVVIEGKTGFLVKPDDAGSMAERILRLASSKRLRQSMGEAGYRHITEKFSFETQTEMYRKLYSQLAGRRARTKKANSPFEAAGKR